MNAQLFDSDWDYQDAQAHEFDRPLEELSEEERMEALDAVSDWGMSK